MSRSVYPGGLGMSRCLGEGRNETSGGMSEVSPYRTWDMVGKRAVRILLECFLVRELYSIKESVAFFIGAE